VNFVGEADGIGTLEFFMKNSERIPKASGFLSRNPSRILINKQMVLAISMRRRT
jgi:hypothetical protein